MLKHKFSIAHHIAYIIVHLYSLSQTCSTFETFFFIHLWGFIIFTIINAFPIISDRLLGKRSVLNVAFQLLICFMLINIIESSDPYSQNVFRVPTNYITMIQFLI